MMTNHLCPHKLNPKSCLQCYNAPKPRTQAVQRPVSAVQQNHLGAPMAALPGTKPPPIVGDRSGAQIGVPGSGQPTVSAEERARYRGEKSTFPSMPIAGPEQPRREPFTSQRNNGAEFSNDKLWEPPVREEVINKLPSHPSAGRS